VRAGVERAGEKEYRNAAEQQDTTEGQRQAAALCVFLASADSAGITGKLISARWDQWRDLPQRVAELRQTDVYTLRRIVPADRGLRWSA
jgi:3-oxoacyl-[acyl-carrier protein] reductase